MPSRTSHSLPRLLCRCAALKCAGMIAVCSKSVDLLLEADRDYNKHGCIEEHDIHKHGVRARPPMLCSPSPEPRSLTDNA